MFPRFRAAIARNFGVYDVLKPIFEFQYIEGQTEVPPPAPKHNHASALNVAKRQALLLKKQKESKCSQLCQILVLAAAPLCHLPRCRKER